MNTAALFGNLNRCCDGMKMEREEKNEQQYCRANKAPPIARTLDALNKHGLEAKQCLFPCQWKMIAMD
jgi:hypothetical protein